MMSRASSQEDALRVADERRRALTAEIPTALGQKAVERKRSGFLNGTLEDSWKTEDVQTSSASASRVAFGVRCVRTDDLRRNNLSTRRLADQPREASAARSVRKFARVIRRVTTCPSVPSGAAC